MAAFSFKSIFNPTLRRLMESIFNTSTGHSHDGVDSKAVTTGTPGAGVVTNAMMAADVKVGSLAALTTTIKTSLQAAINEIVAAYVSLTGTQVLTNKTLTQPSVNGLLEISHDYGGGSADWTLSASELLGSVIKITGAGGAANAIFATTVRNLYLIDNQSGQAITCKNATGASVPVANTKRALLWNNGTSIIRITADL